MKKETFEQAKKIQDRIDCLKTFLEDLFATSCGSPLSINLRHTDPEFQGEAILAAKKAVKDAYTAELENLEKQFDEIK